jgi:hypothetical protein
VRTGLSQPITGIGGTREKPNKTGFRVPDGNAGGYQLFGLKSARRRATGAPLYHPTLEYLISVIQRNRGPLRAPDSDRTAS